MTFSELFKKFDQKLRFFGAPSPANLVYWRRYKNFEIGQAEMDVVNLYQRWTLRKSLATRIEGGGFSPSWHANFDTNELNIRH